MSAYRVIAPLVLVRDEQGRIHHRYYGALVDSIDADHATYLLNNGMVVATALTTRVEAQVEVDSGDPEIDLHRPAHVAPKARWVDYAVAHGFGRDEAEAMTKEQLIAALR